MGGVNRPNILVQAHKSIVPQLHRTLIYRLRQLSTYSKKMSHNGRMFITPTKGEGRGGDGKVEKLIVIVEPMFTM